MENQRHIVGKSRRQNRISLVDDHVRRDAVVSDEPVSSLDLSVIFERPGNRAVGTRRELRGLGRTRLGAAVAPKEIAFVASLPHTRSGKVMRRLLKARELGLPEGDTSTLESGA